MVFLLTKILFLHLFTTKHKKILANILNVHIHSKFDTSRNTSLKYLDLRCMNVSVNSFSNSDAFKPDKNVFIGNSS